MSKLPPLILKVYGDNRWMAEAGFPRTVLHGEWHSTERRGAEISFLNLDDVHEEAREPLQKAIKQLLIAMSYM
jgi:hypothetical protein